jgi:apolipoprotein N-acyltransferase
VWSRVVWVCASACLLSAAVPPYSLGWLAWVALVPLILVVQGASPGEEGPSPWRAAAFGWLFGTLSLAGMHGWLWSLSAFKLVDAAILAVYFALYPAAWCAVLAWLRTRRLPVVLIGALAWTLLHVVRARMGFLALPWEPLSHALTRDVPLLQVASVGGAPLVAFVACIGNLALAEAWRARDYRHLVAPALAIASVHAWGLARAAQMPAGPELHVAVIQPGSRRSPAGELSDTLRTLTLQAAATRPDVVLWPESAVRGFGFAPTLRDAIAELAREAEVPILFGSADFGKYAEAAGTRAEDVQFKNQAFFVAPGGALQGPYTKNRLVPFAEAVPLAESLTWPRWLVARQLHGIAGDAPGLFRLADGRLLGTLICWEDLFSDLSGRLAQAGASAFLQLTNDSDFEGDAEPSQHNVANILRAVEYGRPVIVASTNGPSVAIDARGRVLNVLGANGTSGWMIASVNTDTGTTVYSRCGLYWVWVAGIVAAAVAVFATRRRREHETNTLP